MRALPQVIAPPKAGQVDTVAREAEPRWSAAELREQFLDGRAAVDQPPCFRVPPPHATGAPGRHARVDRRLHQDQTFAPRVARAWRRVALAPRPLPSRLHP